LTDQAAWYPEIGAEFASHSTKNLVQRGLECQTAQCPNADRRRNLLIGFTLAGSAIAGSACFRRSRRAALSLNAPIVNLTRLQDQ
jgi:hypothetical protein